MLTLGFLENLKSEYYLIFQIFLQNLFCNTLSENSEYLDYNDYMKEGWIAFQESEWDIAIDLFNIGLIQESTDYSEAYSGLGWTYLYKANK